MTGWVGRRPAEHGRWRIAPARAGPTAHRPGNLRAAL